jgi:hypothetical protein
MPRSLNARATALALALACVVVAADRPALAADPTTAECVALNEKAGPLQKTGHLREAYANLLRCSVSSCPALVRDDCAKDALQVQAAIPTVVIEARDGAGNDLSSVSLSIDGEARADKLTGVALDVDPGEHVFKFEAAGLPPLEKRFVIHMGEKNRRENIVLGAVVTTPPPPPVAPASGGSALRPLGLVVGGVGIAGLAVGGVFGILAQSKWKQAETDCGAGCPAGAPARDEAQNAHNEAKISNIAFAAGGGVTAVGLIMFLVAPSGKAEPARTGLSLSPLFGSGTVGMAATGFLP